VFRFIYAAQYIRLGLSCGRPNRPHYISALEVIFNVMRSINLRLWRIYKC